MTQTTYCSLVSLAIGRLELSATQREFIREQKQKLWSVFFLLTATDLSWMGKQSVWKRDNVVSLTNNAEQEILSVRHYEGQNLHIP